jgi:hypothetical protein
VGRALGRAVDHARGGHRHAAASIAASSEAGVALATTAPSTSATGARPQEPTQRASSSDSWPSLRVSPLATPRSSLTAAMSASAPLTKQAVPVQTVQVCSPRGSKVNRW